MKKIHFILIALLESSDAQQGYGVVIIRVASCGMEMSRKRQRKIVVAKVILNQKKKKAAQEMRARTM
jgi:hypothetical protein